MRPRWCGARKSRRTRARGTRPPTTSGRTCATSRSSCTPAGRRRRRRRPATWRATTKGRSSWWSRLSANTNEPESGTDHVFLRRRLTEAGRAEVSSWKKTWSVPDSEVEVVPASYSLVFREPGGRSAKAGEKLNGVQHDRRSEGAAAFRVGRRGDAARLAQEGGGAGPARREPDRHRDRQGGARAAGTGRRRAGEDPEKREGRRRLRRGDRPDRHRREGRCSVGGQTGRGSRSGAAEETNTPGDARRSEDRRGAGRRHLEDPGHRPRRQGDERRCAAAGFPIVDGHAARWSSFPRSKAGPPPAAAAGGRRTAAVGSPGTARPHVAPAPARRRAPGAVAVDRRHPHDLQRGQHGAGDGNAQE